MNPRLLSVLLAGLAALSILAAIAAESPPPEALHTVKDRNTPRSFPDVTTRKAWEARAREIREQILVSCGLWPMPERTPLQPHIFGRIERDGYSVENVYFQTFPGFYLAGNLYRPLGKGRGPFPGIINPHGHSKAGRLNDAPDSSTPARCISFARQGMIAFAYDMVGWNDTHFSDAPANRPFYEIHRQFATNRADLLWNISLMGLQTWNSIRALDFLAALPGVDPTRLACTGESGGGTQTYILGAVDDRLAAQAPVVMVSHTMQGGCSCENAPGLRVEYSNMEISAAAAPRPQLLVAATGDWTKDTLTVEGPAIQHIYQLLGAPDKLRYVRFDAGHNYNQTSREAVYDWFGRWLLKHPDPASLKEAPYQKEPDANLRIFPDGHLPADALTQEPFIASLRALHQTQWQSLLPRSKVGLAKFKTAMLPAWRHTLQVEWPDERIHSEAQVPITTAGFRSTCFRIGRGGDGAIVQATCYTPPGILPNSGSAIVVLGAASGGPAAQPSTVPTPLALSLLQRGMAVLAVDHFRASTLPDQFSNFFTTYNRTLAQERVGDLTRICSFARSQLHARRVVLCGTGAAGLWVLLAAPAADAVIADCNQLDVSSDEALLAPDLFCPGIRNLGTFEGAAILAAPHPLLLHNTGSKFPTASLRCAYDAARANRHLRLESSPLTDEALVNWAAQIE